MPFALCKTLGIIGKNLQIKNNQLKSKVMKDKATIKSSLSFCNGNGRAIRI